MTQCTVDILPAFIDPLLAILLVVFHLVRDRLQPTTIPHQRSVWRKCSLTAPAATSSFPSAIASMIAKCSSIAGTMRSGSSGRECWMTEMRSRLRRSISCALSFRSAAASAACSA